jgi:hypothetical protein
VVGKRPEILEALVDLAEAHLYLRELLGMLRWNGADFAEVGQDGIVGLVCHFRNSTKLLQHKVVPVSAVASQIVRSQTVLWRNRAGRINAPVRKRGRLAGYGASSLCENSAPLENVQNGVSALA